jgi:hypothetical protein
MAGTKVPCGCRWRLAAGKRKTMERDQTVIDSRKERCAGEEDNETNLGVEAEFAGDVRGGRKSSPNHRRKFVGTQAADEKLRRGVEGATSGGSR